jgi:hypothetical protein
MAAQKLPRIGVLTRDELKALNRALFVFLGLSQAA